jgi:hypothetical protein
MIRNPKITHAELMTLVTGPDYPGGAQIITPASNIADIYNTGRGSLKVRARWTIEELARGQWQLVVTELPPGTSSQRVQEEIEEITNPKIKTGKKALLPEQLSLKQNFLLALDTMRDESGREAPVRLVFEPKSKNQDKAEFALMLLAHTSLETSSPINLVMIGGDGRPRQKGLSEILQEWVDFRFVTVRRRTEFKLRKVTDRIHILEGREIVLLNIDEVIAIIRNSDEPKAALIERFNLSERQAEDILEIRLRQLARLEAIKIQQELAELRGEKEKLEDILENPNSMKRLIVREIEADAKQYGDDRRTLIEEAQKAVAEQKVIDEPVTVIVSEKGWVRARTGIGHDTAAFTFKAGDSLGSTFECRTVDNLLCIGDNGKAYSVPVNALPGARGDGVPISTLVDLTGGVRILYYFVGPADTRLLLATSTGFGFIAKAGDMATRRRRRAAGAARGGGTRRRNRLPVRERPRAGIRHRRNESADQWRPRRHADGTGTEGNPAGGAADHAEGPERDRYLGGRQAAHGGAVRVGAGTALRQAGAQGQGAVGQAQGAEPGDAPDRCIGVRARCSPAAEFQETALASKRKTVVPAKAGTTVLGLTKLFADYLAASLCASAMASARFSLPLACALALSAFASTIFFCAFSSALIMVFCAS